MYKITVLNKNNELYDMIKNIYKGDILYIKDMIYSTIEYKDFDMKLYWENKC